MIQLQKHNSPEKWAVSYDCRTIMEAVQLLFLFTLFFTVQE
ncbi:hypothetical protein HMPREF0813_00841 [Streptococcus anginosus F0211]|uniref:Uncharacterized protein n=1 Tax=Streptococcus anginosus F0211 TaxID=706437 RepID=E6J0R8_STRAP|nr:hypothetical protein SanJ4206_0185 [Streptococcus anginosus]EFU22526.1 hypothetical protein HMPREF0813_00841 [Streptococcus anginosus F0211]ETS97291.1 hypothetical protein HMPREF1512_0695 [Streptococcus sp. OBRC6]EUB13025.1 hypothetical protein HMPREF1510_1432 [Streptococcus sp. ACC21]EUC75758.1 hypothetical protein HMPREF1511_0151 [Streptococcus sp. CM7]EWC98778.1 hypothetical protein HMPREF1509_0860 [Streptococcus sp. AC15]